MRKIYSQGSTSINGDKEYIKKDLKNYDHFKRIDHHLCLDFDDIVKQFIEVPNDDRENYEVYTKIYHHDNKTRVYIVAVHIPNNIEELEQYCQCNSCQSIFQPFIEWLGFDVYTGCLKTRGLNLDPYVLKRTIEYKDNLYQ